MNSQLKPKSSGGIQPATPPSTNHGAIEAVVSVGVDQLVSTWVPSTINPSQVLDLPGFIDLEEVLVLIPIGRSKWYEGVKSGIYPKPVPLGDGRRRAYRRRDVKALVQRLDQGQG